VNLSGADGSGEQVHSDERKRPVVAAAVLANV
jgi:hypothetical protein